MAHVDLETFIAERYEPLLGGNLQFCLHKLLPLGVVFFFEFALDDEDSIVRLRFALALFCNLLHQVFAL